MNIIKVLDCTLRDGGRILNCNFGSEAIKQIVFGLDNSYAIWTKYKVTPWGIIPRV